MATVHIICGPIGAGKTTRAQQLARELPGVRFSLDEWIVTHFGKEMPEPMNIEWWTERADRCITLIWAMCRQLLALDVDVVLDCGAPSRAHREQWRELAREAGASVKLHVVTADPSVRRERVRARNRGKPETFALTVTDAMFEGSEEWWEPPTAEELGDA